MSKKEKPNPSDLKLMASTCPGVNASDNVEVLRGLIANSVNRYIAVLEGKRPVGMVCLDDVHLEDAEVTKKGFLANFRTKPKPDILVSNVMIQDPLIIEHGTETDVLFQTVFERKGEFLKQDVILVRQNGDYFGMITSNAIFRRLYGFLGRHMKELRLQKERVTFKHSQVVKVKRDLELTNQQLEASRDKALMGVKMKNSFLANMSHEIRTPMNGVFGMIDLLYDTEMDEDQEQLLSTARSSAETLMRIIDDILDFSKIEAGKVSVETMPFSLTEVVESSVALYSEAAAEKDVELTLKFEDTPPWVVGDPHRYQQVLNNLISNAIKFTDDGSVQVIVSGVCTETGNGILTEVLDSGIGIPQEKIDTLFQPFTQADDSTVRKYGGTGLGLSISKNLVELLDGTIECDSRRSGGTVFSFVLPFEHYENLESSKLSARVSEEMVCTPSVHSTRSDFSGMKVLVVEDNIVNQEVAKRFLTKLHCDVDFADNGQSALEYMRADAYDCIFMDCQMPVMDGYEATRLIRLGSVSDSGKDVFISAMTAHAMSGDRDLCLEAGMDHYFSKPFGLQDFREALVLCTEKAKELYSSHASH